MNRIAIVEDEAHYKAQLVEFLRNFEQELGEHIEIATYADGDLKTT